MKHHLLAAIFVVLGATAFAERLSTDETAVRLGAREWLSLRASETGRFDFTKLKNIYRTDLQFTDPATGNPADVRGLDAYTARLQPLVEKVQKYAAVLGNDIRVSMNGNLATTSFTFRSEGLYKDGSPVTCSGRVNLTWERRLGFWQITREETMPLNPAVPSEIATAK